MTLPASDVFSPDAFRGRVYGVTGSGRGIGEATIKHLAKLGASVVVIDLDPVLKRKLALEKRGMDMVWSSDQPWPEEGHASHVANAILFLLSDAARFITGASLWVDGGANVYSSNHAFRAWMGTFDLTRIKRDGKEYRAILKKYPQFGE